MFFYYLPGVAPDQVTRETLQAGPLAPIFWDLLRSPALFEARIRVFHIHAHGPDKLSGCIVAAMPAGGLEGPPPGMRDGQSWTRVADGNYWIGFDQDAPPAPDELQREYVVTGPEHELGDGRIWTCPIVRRQGVQNALPSRWGVDPTTGEYASTMLPRYSAAWAAAGKILNAQFGGELSRQGALDLCVQMLAINYRIGVHEVSLLGLLDDTNWKLIWRAATDADFLDEWLESQQPDGSVKKA